MGTSTDAILCFGFPVGEEDQPHEWLEDCEGDFDKFLNKLSGMPEYGEPGHSFDDQRKFRESCPAEMVMHCSYDYPMYILCVQGTETRAWRGSPKEVPNLYVYEGDISAFKSWCEANEIEYQDPKWYLCRYVGLTNLHTNKGEYK